MRWVLSFKKIGLGIENCAGGLVYSENIAQGIKRDDPGGNVVKDGLDIAIMLGQHGIGSGQACPAPAGDPAPCD